MLINLTNKQLEKIIEKEFMPFKDAVHLTLSGRLLLFSARNIGLDYDGMRYWFRLEKDGLKLYAQYNTDECPGSGG